MAAAEGADAEDDEGERETNDQRIARGQNAY